jgi:hypothetical protein
MGRYQPRLDRTFNAQGTTDPSLSSGRAIPCSWQVRRDAGQDGAERRIEAAVRLAAHANRDVTAVGRELQRVQLAGAGARSDSTSPIFLRNDATSMMPPQPPTQRQHHQDGELLSVEKAARHVRGHRTVTGIAGQSPLRHDTSLHTHGARYRRQAGLRARHQMQ